MKNILCYGDSNTFGFNPVTRGRFNKETRWTGILAKKLGSEFNIIEAGLNGRTTMWNDPKRPLRNGLEMIDFTLDEHKPVDLIILSLGINDTKSYYGLSAKAVSDGINALIQKINYYPWNSNYPSPKILVVCPPSLTDDSYLEDPFSEFNKESVKVSKDLNSFFSEVAQLDNVFYLDSAKEVHVGPDGVHLDKSGHKKMAEIIFKKVNEIL